MTSAGVSRSLTTIDEPPLILFEIALLFSGVRAIAGQQTAIDRSDHIEFLVVEPYILLHALTIPFSRFTRRGPLLRGC